jgi:hypothetical protein
MIVVLAASDSGRIIFTKSFEADAARIFARILGTALYKVHSR